MSDQSTHERVEIFYFEATPVNGSSPCSYCAVYSVTRENGHWVYCLQPGTLTALTHTTALESREQMKNSAAT
jgi:hypothetical protein